MQRNYKYEYRTASHLGRRITRRVYGQMTLDGGRRVSHELMTRYFRMLRYKLESSLKIR